MTAPQVKNQKPSVSVKDEKTFEKEEHQLIYDTFMKVLEDKAKSKENEGITDAFISTYKNILLSNVNPEDIRPLSEENFCQFLLSVFKEIREQGLAREEKLNNDKIQQIITKCVADIRGTEAKDSLIKLAGWPLGVKIDPKNFFSSFKDGLLEKVPFLGKGKKEEDEPPPSDEEMVTTFLRKSLLPAALFVLTTLTFGTGPIMLSIAVIGLLITEVKVVKSLFSNDKKGTLYNPDSQDKKQRKEWDKEISDGISKILETSGKGSGKGEQPTEEQLTQKSGQSTALEQVAVDQLNTGQQTGKTT